MMINTRTAAVNAKFKNMTTAQLIDTFIVSGHVEDKNIYTVRGWIMEELEERNPDAFNAWLDSDDCEDKTLRKYFK